MRVGASAYGLVDSRGSSEREVDRNPQITRQYFAELADEELRARRLREDRLRLDASARVSERRYTRSGDVAGVHHPNVRAATSGTHEIQRSEYTERFATDPQLERCFLHYRMIACSGFPSYVTASVPAHELARHASMTLSGDGNVQRAMSPANPRVTRSFPS